MTNLDIQSFTQQLSQSECGIRFEDSMAIIEALYDYSPSAFTNGAQTNAQGENAGSCKIFAFAQINQLNQQQTLNLFGQFYQDVLSSPEASDHQNIRQFMQNGWSGIQFSAAALSPKA